MTRERPATIDIEIPLLLEAIYQRFHYDFRSYSRASLKRRIGAALTDMRCDSVSMLQAKLLQHPELFTRMLQFLTVQVSDMFRDPSFFKAFRTHVVPELLTYPSVKIWIAGASTGEEVYSYAIALHEEGLLDRTILYATDINPEALRRAETGVYPLDRVRLFSENYLAAGGKTSLSQYYTAAYGSAAFDRRLREHVVFSDHSLATDSVFAEVHVVSCRNVLIYFDRELQTRALKLFKEALARRGFLGLGSKETLQFSTIANDFEQPLPSERWYQRW